MVAKADPSVDLASYGYGAVIIAGGLIGYLKASE